MIVLNCNGKVRVVESVVISTSGHIGTSLVDGGNTDLFDLGYTVEELDASGLEIKSDIGD